MKVLYVAPEAAPFIKTGGLGDVAGSLPVELKEKGIDARVILPLYSCIDRKYREQMRFIDSIYINLGWRSQYVGIFELIHEGTTFYFLDNEFYFSGDKPYGYIHLDCEKFIFFSKAALSVLPTIDFRPDVINCNDWQTAAIPVFLDTFADNPFYQGIKTVMTIHNLMYQGRWDLEKIKDFMGIGDYYFTDDKLEYHKDGNLLKGGLVYAHKISTVSESYAEEITTEAYGEGLDGLLRARRHELVGIVNGISYKDWNPQTDPMIYKNYSKETALEIKKQNKVALQKELNLPVDENVFMVGVVSRLTDQKGFDLVAQALDQICAGGIQLVILGTGDEKYENLFRHYAWKYADRVSANIYFSNELSHKIYAACDAFLMPSGFEPCGLSQIISMHYGTIPIVRETGGLRDTVDAYNEFTGTGTGFSFGAYDAHDMMHVVQYAMDVYYNRKEAWAGLMKQAMERDYSWGVSADQYIKMYRELTGIYDEEPQKQLEAESVVTEDQQKPTTKKPATKKPAQKKPETKAKKEEPSNAKKPVKKTTAKQPTKKAGKPTTEKTKKND